MEENQLHTPEEQSTAETDNKAFESRTELNQFRDAVEQLRTEVGRIIVGQHRMVELITAAILSGGHILIEGVPGVAKTLAAKLMARAIDTQFSRIQFTPDLMPSDVLGTTVFNAKTAEFEFRQGPVFSNIVLIDEINRAPAKTQAALFEVMEERQITIDGTRYLMEPPFIVIATQNPIEQEGTYRLPEAQLDRFLFKIEVSYPSVDEEVRILDEFHSRQGINDLSKINAVLSAEQVRIAQNLVRSLHIDRKLLTYIVQIVDATRNSKDIYLGASPRASLNIMTSSKAIAAMRGRDFVTPEDVQYIAGAVLQHRIMLTPEKEMEGAQPEDVIQTIIESVEVPR
ncbi:MAG: MoxR family ATPase [Bacteroidota bacterium]